MLKLLLLLISRMSSWPPKHWKLSQIELVSVFDGIRFDQVLGEWN